MLLNFFPPFPSLYSDFLIPVLLSLLPPLHLFLFCPSLILSYSQFFSCSLLLFLSHLFPVISPLSLFLFWLPFRFAVVIPLFLFNVFRFILPFIFYALSSSLIFFFSFPFLLNRLKTSACDATINANKDLYNLPDKDGRYLEQHNCGLSVWAEHYHFLPHPYLVAYVF